MYWNGSILWGLKTSWTVQKTHHSPQSFEGHQDHWVLWWFISAHRDEGPTSVKVTAELGLLTAMEIIKPTPPHHQWRPGGNSRSWGDHNYLNEQEDWRVNQRGLTHRYLSWSIEYNILSDKTDGHCLIHKKNARLDEQRAEHCCPNLKENSWSLDVERLEPLCTVGGSVKWCNHYRK